jgi:hypothetical protein
MTSPVLVISFPIVGYNTLVYPLGLTRDIRVSNPARQDEALIKACVGFEKGGSLVQDIRVIFPTYS